MTRAQTTYAALAIVLGLLAAFTYGSFVAAHAHAAGQQSATCTYGTVRSIAGTYCEPAIGSYLDSDV